MMVSKRITTKKTGTGYSIYVFVEDGSHVKPIIACLERYFQWASGESIISKQKRIIEEVNYESEQLGKAVAKKEA